MKMRSYPDCKAVLEANGFTVSVPKYRFIVEYTECEFSWYFDNLSELGAFVEGIEVALEFMTS